MDDLEARVIAVLPEVTELRHELHRIPEIHGEERKTSGLLRERLTGSGLEVAAPLIGTDVVALLRGGRPGKNVTLRADIDALPVDDASQKSWKSTHPGYSHACGHDGHMAVLMGALRVLAGMRDHLHGSVRFVFQPAEEETGGGRRMVEKGLLDTEPRPAAVFALHGWPGVRLGSIASAPGPMLAAADRFTIRVTGKGTHGARPHAGVDPVLTASQLVLALQGVVSRSIDPLKPAVLSVCSIHGGRASNVIPTEVVMEGTTRYFDASLKDELRRRMEEIVRGVCAAAGAAGSLEYEEGYIPLVNDAAMVGLAREVVEKRLGASEWIEGIAPSMGAEDFAYYLGKVPGAFLRLGLGEGSADLHNPAFDFDDRALRSGITIMCGLALEVLRR